MALQKFAHGATHYCKFKHTALCENALHYDNKTTMNKQILCRFQKFSRCFAPCQVDLWAETFPFSAFLSLENTQTSSVAIFFHTHVLPHHSKTQLLRYCGKRSFKGVAKSWKVTLDRVPWFGRHVENLGGVIIYPVLVVARTDAWHIQQSAVHRAWPSGAHQESLRWHIWRPMDERSPQITHSQTLESLSRWQHGVNAEQILQKCC